MWRGTGEGGRKIRKVRGDGGVNAITDPSYSSLSQEEPRQRLAAAQSRLDEAIKAFELIKMRNDLSTGFIEET